MDDPASSQPPPLPAPPSTATELQLPHPAPLFWRITAYLIDWSIATVAVLLLLRWTIPSEHPTALADFQTWISETYHGYMALFSASHSPPSSATIQAFAEKAAQMPQTVQDLLAYVAMVQTLFFWAFFTLSEYFTDGASLGKRICNLRVASVSGFGRPGFFDTFFRSGWKAVFFCSSSLPLLLIGAIDAHVPLFNKRRRSWHDMISRTEVVDARTDPWLGDTVEEEDDVF